jgi:hypothetical protein
MKVVINTCHGGFNLSDAAMKLYSELKGLNLIWHKGRYFDLTGYDFYVDEVKDENYFSRLSIERNDPMLVQVVEQLGEEADGKYSKLKVVEIPDDVNWVIDEYDGAEWVAEVHRTWN